MFNKDDKRFIKIFKEGTLTESMEILLDTETGVNYLYIGAGYGMGITPSWVLMEKLLFLVKEK